ncbi:MATE family efflux transporter [Anaerocolumna sp. MB42-C2]|uniref:MATE family efflux transporter n=1 Tax=Anaerocolumna sp. MB42-C2 TaxID=3070997 RepID=UPI0027DF137C|nr:MATE family efflux transporter [Anaerocolumna sp. MB42-C2]WMJ86862.1 MATE family efflux transporter [Anaerocolumna sp. MB42-C2]
MKIQLSDHFTYKKLIRFTIPSIAMMVFTSIYGVVDGFFVSNFVGKIPFAAVNFIMPFNMILSAIGFMFGTGGSALVAKTMGEGHLGKANRQFSLLVYVSIISGIFLTIISIIFIPQIASLLGAKGEMLNNCVQYSRIVLFGMTGFILQMVFSSFFVTAEKPQLGLFVTVASGVANILLDAILVGLLKQGLMGAAVATAISQLIGGGAALAYFLSPNSSLLRLTKTNYDGKAILRACANGSSELMSNISMSVVGMLYNIQLIKYAGADGVAAYGVLMYVNLIFLAVFIGYSIGTAPIISYHFGAANHAELKNVMKKSIVIISIFSIGMFVSAELSARSLSAIFVGYDEDLLSITLRGFFIYSFSFLFAGAAIFGSSFFTALNNALISATISFLRTLVFEIMAVLLLPLLFGIDGIWYSIIFAEVMAFTVAILFLIGQRKRYQY